MEQFIVKQARRLLKVDEVYACTSYFLRLNNILTLLKGCKIEYCPLDINHDIVFSNRCKRSNFHFGDHLGLCTTPQGFKFVSFRSNGPIPIVYLIFRKSDLVNSKLIRELKLLGKSEKTAEEIDKDKPILQPDFLKDILANSIEYLEKVRTVKKLKAQRGLIFSGAPGNGKTMVSRYLTDLADTHDIEVTTFNGAHLKRGYSENSLSTYLNREGIIFFDDVDISFFSRKNGGEMACAILSAMDGLVEKEVCIRIFTTNEDIGGMDAAFLRPGRIDKIFKFEAPSLELRKQFINSWEPELLDEINASTLLSKTQGFSFAELAEVRNASLLQILFNEPVSLDAILSSAKKEIPSMKKGIGFQV